MPKKLFGSTDRNKSHQKLAKILAAGKHPRACCVEDTNNPTEPYQVWSDNHPPNAPLPEPPRQTTVVEDAMLTRLADLVVAKLAVNLRGEE